MSDSIQQAIITIDEVERRWLLRYEILSRAACSMSRAGAEVTAKLYGALDKLDGLTQPISKDHPQIAHGLDDPTRTLIMDFLLDACAICVLTNQPNDNLKAALLNFSGQSPEICERAVSETVQHYVVETAQADRDRRGIVPQ